MTRTQRSAIVRGALLGLLLTFGLAWVTVYLWKQAFAYTWVWKFWTAEPPFAFGFAIPFTILTTLLGVLDIILWRTALFGQNPEPAFDNGFARFFAKEFLPNRAEFQTMRTELLGDTKARLGQLAVFMVKLLSFTILMAIGGLVATLSVTYLSDDVLYVLGSLLGLCIGLYGLVKALITIWKQMILQTLKS